MAAGQVASMHDKDLPDVLAKTWFDCFRKHRPAVIPSFAVTNDDDVVTPIEILNPQTEALEQPEARAVLQQCDQSIHPWQLSDDSSHLLLGQDDWQSLGPDRSYDSLDAVQRPAEDRTVQEQQCREGLVLS